uniref:Uncharacterized protein n=1 Tax=Arundo donax TaxID=35708 RepID=A0A0A9FFB3_ARUDO
MELWKLCGRFFYFALRSMLIMKSLPTSTLAGQDPWPLYLTTCGFVLLLHVR